MAFGKADTGGKSIREKIAEHISNVAPQVEENVLEVFVTREVDKRAKAVVNVIDQLVKLEGEARKIKPDQVSLNDKGEEVASTYSKNKFEEKKKLDEKIQKFANAVNKALEKGDYGDVYNLSSGKSSEEDRS